MTPRSILQSVLANILVGDSSLSTWEQKLLIPFEGGSPRKRVSFILWFALATAPCSRLLAEKVDFDRVDALMTAFVDKPKLPLTITDPRSIRSGS
jgi:hypothetical protein